MSVEFDVQMKPAYMYEFLINHTYRSFQGVLSILLGIGAVVLAVVTWGDVEVTYSICYLFFGVLFFVYLPLSLWSRAKRQVRMTPMFAKPLTYKLDETGITASQDEQDALTPWTDVQKVSKTRHCIVVYMSKVRAFVWPQVCMGDRSAQTEEILRSHVDAAKVKL